MKEKKPAKGAVKSPTKLKLPFGAAVGSVLEVTYDEELTKQSGKKDWEDFFYGVAPGVLKKIDLKNNSILLEMWDGENPDAPHWELEIDLMAGVSQQDKIAISSLTISTQEMPVVGEEEEDIDYTL